MEIGVLRQKLHEYVDTADKKHIEAIYELIIGKPNASEKYDEATLEMFYQRRENHLSGKSKSYTVEESLDMIRKMKKP